MDHQDLVAAAGTMDADEIADLVADLPADVVAEVQRGLTDEERAQLIEAMGYPEDTVGAIMDFDMVRVREDVPLEVVLRYLRRLHELRAEERRVGKEGVSTCRSRGEADH